MAEILHSAALCVCRGKKKQREKGGKSLCQPESAFTVWRDDNGPAVLEGRGVVEGEERVACGWLAQGFG